MAGFSASSLLGQEQTDGGDYRTIRDKFPHRPTLFLGLGGTGCQSVSKIKGLFNDVYLPVARKGSEAPVSKSPPFYAFLGFDTNASELPPNLQQGTEWFHFGVASMDDFYAHNAKERMYSGWVCPKLQSTAVTTGAQGYRNLGKICLYFNMDTFVEKVNAARSQIIKADTRMVNTTPIVYVMCSLAGGTGSGMFLDACFFIRQNFPAGTRIVGLLATPEGLSTDSEDQEKVAVGTFCALRELDAFMTGNAVGFKENDAISYPSSARGRVAPPFDECYLIHQNRDDGNTTLPTASHISSFIARSVFMLSAYAFETLDYRGELKNKEDRLWRQKRRGTYFRYLVPAMGQIQFPIETIAKLFVLDAARNYITWQSGGRLYEGREGAENFAAQNRLTVHNLRALVSRDPSSGQAPELYHYDELLAKLMKGKARYKNREAILSLGDRIPDGRLDEIVKVLRTNVDALVDTALPAIENEVRRLLVNPEYLYRGSLDFVADLILVMRDSAETALAEFRTTMESDYGELARRWAALRGVVEDVVTPGNLYDRAIDNVRADRTRESFCSLLNEAEEIVVRKARNDLALEVINRVLAFLTALYDDLKDVFETRLSAAAKLIEQRRLPIYALLQQSELGQGAGVEDIRSVSALSEEWRKDHFARQDRYKPEHVLSSLLGQGWHPYQAVRTGAKHANLSMEALATQILERIIPLAEPDLAMSPSSMIASGAEGLEGGRPASTAAGQLSGLLQPQYPILSGHSILNAKLSKIHVCGGMDDKVLEAIKTASAFQDDDKFLRASSWELNKISFFVAHLPVGLAGCTPVRRVFESGYKTYREQLEKSAGGAGNVREEMMRFHCFAQSEAWPNPTQFHRDVTEEMNHFAKALAVSEIFPCSVRDTEAMDACGSDPRTKLYGVFQTGRKWFWMWPFFEPTMDGDGGVARAVIGKQVKLGSNITDAYDAYHAREDLVGHARRWSEWMDEAWTRYYRDGEMRAALGEAIVRLAARRSARDEDQSAIWDTVIRVLQEWEEANLGPAVKS